MGRVATLIIAATAACAGEPNASQSRESTRVELTLERELGARVGVPVRVRCVWIAPGCRAKLPDGSQLGVRFSVHGGEVVWRIDGALVLADDIEAYLRDALADLGAPQVARCGARIRSVAVGDRVQCQLQDGGKAFVIVKADGTTSIEIVLDAVAGDARSEVVTIEREASLLEMSRKLEDDADSDDVE